MNNSRPRRGSVSSWPDVRLVAECLAGSEKAWQALIDKYHNLIFSVPLNYGLAPEDAADIFQAVCLELIAELPRLRRAEALPKWLLQVTFHKCFHWKRELGRFVEHPDGEISADEASSGQDIPEGLLRSAEKEQALREGLAGLPPRCRELIQMLFFESPARPYREVAKRLGLSAGSIGFIRARCLKKLRDQLEKMGVA